MLLAVPALSSCGANFGAQTDQYYNPADGTSNRDGAVEVINAMIISDQPGSGRLIAALVNTGDTVADQFGAGSTDTGGTPSATPTTQPDALTGVAGVGVDQSVTFTLEGGDTTIPADGTLQLASDGSAVVGVSGDAERISPGDFVQVKFSFQNAQPATLQVPVLAPGTTYQDIPIPSPSPSTSTGMSTESPSAAPSESASEPAASSKSGKKG